MYSCNYFYSSHRCQTFGERTENMSMNQNFVSAVSHCRSLNNIRRQDGGSTATSRPFHRGYVSLYSHFSILILCEGGGKSFYIIRFHNSSYFFFQNVLIHRDYKKTKLLYGDVMYWYKNKQNTQGELQFVFERFLINAEEQT